MQANCAHHLFVPEELQPSNSRRKKSAMTCSIFCMPYERFLLQKITCFYLWIKSNGDSDNALVYQEDYEWLETERVFIIYQRKKTKVNYFSLVSEIRSRWSDDGKINPLKLQADAFIHCPRSNLVDDVHK